MGIMDKLSGMDDVKNSIKSKMPATKFCENCGYKIPIDAEICPLCNKPADEIDPARLQKKLEKEENERIDKEIEAKSADMLLSTCHSLEGYKIVETYGIVYGETLFKAGFLKALAQSIANIVDYFTFGDLELSGSAELLADARKYAEKKLKKEAYKKGANAVIGVDAETSVGGQVMHVMIYGTAVKLEKE